MKTVIMVSEENHGFIGLVEKEERVVDFLISQGWLDGNTLLYSNALVALAYIENDEDISVCEYFGDNWESQLKALSLFDLSVYFEDTFLFTIETVFE